MDSPDFEEAVSQYYPGLVQRLTLVLHDAEEAKDVAQEAYLRAYQAWDRFDGNDLRAWLHTIALRLAFNGLRRRRLWQTFVRGERARNAPWLTPERVDLWNALGSLRPEHRAAVLLNVVDGYTQSEIADILGSPPGTVASWIASAKAVLRTLLQDAAP